MQIQPLDKEIHFEQGHSRNYGQAVFELINEAFATFCGYSALSQRQIDESEPNSVTIFLQVTIGLWDDNLP